MICALLMPVPGFAQDDGEGVLVRFLENRLSDGAARVIDLQGFRGALSSTARLDRLTIADEAGVWLTVENAELSWNRLALLQGRLDVDTLVAEGVVLDRLPDPENTGPRPEAEPFQFPDLPVDISIDTARIGTFRVGPTVLDHPITATIDATAQIGDSNASVRLTAERLDDTAGTIAFATSFDAQAETLAIDLNAEEDQGGLVASLLNLPQTPALSLMLEGDGTLSDFAADLRLGSGGETRFGGSATLTRTDAGDRVIGLDLTGDLSPLLRGAARDFLGDDTDLNARATLAASGAVSVDAFGLNAGRLTLSGAGAVDAEARPVAFDLTAAITPQRGTDGPVTLPGRQVRLRAGDITVAYDRAESDRIVGRGRLTEVATDNLRADLVGFSIDGTIPTDVAGMAEVALTLALTASGIDSPDPALAEALGTRLRLGTDVGSRSDAPLRLDDLTLVTDTLSASGDVSVDPGQNRLDVAADLDVSAPDLTRFAGLAGRPLAGDITSELRITGDLLSGAFDARIGGAARDLAIGGVPGALLAGTPRLTVRVARDTTGTRIDRIAIDADAVRAALQGRISSAGSALTLTARMPDLGAIDPALSGAAVLDASAERAGGDADIRLPELRLTTAYGTVTAEGAATGFGPEDRLRLEIATQITDAAALSVLTNGPVSGRADLRAEAVSNGAFTTAEIDLSGSLRDVVLTGVVPPGLLDGTTEIGLNAAVVDQVLDLRRLTVDGRNVTLDASGSSAGADAAFQATARLSDVGLVTPAVRGPVDATATLGRVNGDIWRAEAVIDGPGGLRLTASGPMALADATADLAITGQAPLALANRVLSPRSVQGQAALDLRLNGPLAMTSLSGQVSTRGAQISAPNLDLAIRDIAATATVSNGQVGARLTGALSTGGDLQVDGRVGLTQPGLPVDFDIDLTDARLVDADLYEALIDRVDASVTGALTTRLTAAGRIDIDTVNGRIPDAAISGGGPIPVIQHIGETAAQRRTRAFAGLLDRGGGGTGGPRVALDLTVDAPNRIFIRGRGLDAELGGRLTIMGTADAPVAAGRFDLIRGRLNLLSQRFDLDEGSVTIVGGEPFLRLTAVSQTDDHTIFIDVAGPASAPIVSFRSNPDLPEDEVIAQLLFGRSAGSLSPFQALRLANAVAVLAGRGSDTLGAIRDGLGIDDLDIRTDEDGNTGVRIGRYLSENVYTDVTVENDGTTLNLNIDLTPNLTARGSVGGDAESSLGLFFERDY